MKNREFEVKLELTEAEALFVQKKLSGKELQKGSYQKDRYYCPAGIDSRKFMQKSCLRIRTQDGKISLDYKEILSQHDAYIQQLIEYSTMIADAQIMDAILRQLGLSHVLTVEKKRQEYIYNSIYKIAIDHVDMLGYFLEIEMLDESKTSASWIDAIIKDLNIGEVRINKTGYSNMIMDLQKEETQ